MTVTISVPATTANLGLGFDSLGLAVNLYLSVTVERESDEWYIRHPFGKEVPTDASNLIVQTALAVAPTLKPHHLTCKSQIPMTRGLGSSSSAIVAGIELANQLASLNLTPQEKVELATRFEGHPDNVAPAILGNLVFATYNQDSDTVTTLGKKINHEIQLIALIPDVELSTKASRQVLPTDLPYATAVAASSRSNVLVAALCQEKWDVVGDMIEQDLFHEPYRKQLIPFLEPVRRIAATAGAIGTYLSGAGPTVMIMTHETHTFEVIEALQEQLPSDLGNYQVQLLAVDHHGVRTMADA